MTAQNQIKQPEFYLLVDHVHYKGGMWNLQRARIVPVGNAWAYLKMFTSQVDKAGERAKRWAKKHGLKIVGA